MSQPAPTGGHYPEFCEVHHRVAALATDPGMIHNRDYRRSWMVTISMRLITPIKIVLIGAVLFLALSPGSAAVQPAHALSAAVGHFMADCTSFSVDLAVT